MKRLYIILPVLLLLSFLGDVSTTKAATGGDDENEFVMKLKGGWLGVKIRDVTEEAAEEAGLNDATGARVYEVVEDSPADSAGIEVDDIIIAFNNVEIEDADALVKAVGKSDPGSMVTVTLMRDGTQMTLDVRLGKAKQRIVRVMKNLRMPRAPRPPRPPRAPRMGIGGHGMTWDHTSSYGLVIETLGEQLAAYFGTPDGEGVLVKEVEEDSDAAKAGFKAGDVILRAGKKTVEDVKDFKHVLGAYDPGEKIPVQILRKGKEMTLELTAKEIDEHRFKLYGRGGPHVFRFRSGDEDIELEGIPDAEEIVEIVEQALENVPEMDIDIDIDAEDMREGIREMRIMLNGKEIEMQELHEELREHMEEMREKIEVEVEEGRVRIRSKQI